MKAKIINILLSDKSLAVVELEDGYEVPMWNKVNTNIEIGMTVNVSEILLDVSDEEYVKLESV